MTVVLVGRIRLMPIVGLRTVAQSEIIARRTKNLISLVGTASRIPAPSGGSGTAIKTGMVIVIGTVVVTGIAKETERRNGIVITGIETVTETEIEKGNETGIDIVVTTRIVTGTLEKNATMPPPAVRYLLLHSGLTTAVF
jgi:hypothetical protein